MKTKAISEQAVDTDKWTLKNDKAQVAQQQALVDYQSIKAPFSGRLGIRQVDLGQYLSAGTTVVTLQQLDPIYLDFYLPEQTLDQIKVGQPITAKIDAYPGHDFAGEISAIDSIVDVATRNVQIRATLKNPDRAGPGHVRDGEYRCRNAPTATSRCLKRRLLTAVTAIPSTSSRTRAKAPTDGHS